MERDHAPAAGPPRAGGADGVSEVGSRGAWAPDLGTLRLLGNGSSSVLLSPEAEVLWWCAPGFDDEPFCWRLLDQEGGRARFLHLEHVQARGVPAGPSATTLLRDRTGRLDVRDALLSRAGGVVLARLVRRREHLPGGDPVLEHELVLGGFESPEVTWTLSADGTRATGVLPDPSRRTVHVVGGVHEVQGTRLVTRLEVRVDQWTALTVGLDSSFDGPPEELLQEVGRLEEAAEEDLATARLPGLHPQRALDALRVVRTCTNEETGAVVASPTTSLPEAPGHDRQFDYRYSWLRDASLSTAVAALLGQGEDARKYLAFVHEAWEGRDLLTTPVLDVRGGDVPAEREVDGVAGWAGSRPVRVGNGAKDQVQYDSVGLFAEAVSVYVQVGGELDEDTWALLSRLADDAARDAGEVKESNGIWEMRRELPLVDGDIGRWLLLDRAIWVARGWRPWTRRSHWKEAREVVRDRVLGAFDDSGLLPQAYGQDPGVPDASALMAVAFGLLDPDDPRAHRLVDVLRERLGAGRYLRRYPPGGDDGFQGREGAFLPVSFLLVTSLAKLGRVEEAGALLDELFAALPRLLSEEVDPGTGRSLGNTPLVWSHAEAARAVYVLDAALRRERWGRIVSWGWRAQRYLRLRHQMRAPRGPE